MLWYHNAVFTIPLSLFDHPWRSFCCRAPWPLDQLTWTLWRILTRHDYGGAVELHASLSKCIASQKSNTPTTQSFCKQFFETTWLNLVSGGLLSAGLGSSGKERKNMVLGAVSLPANRFCQPNLTEFWLQPPQPFGFWNKIFLFFTSALGPTELLAINQYKTGHLIHIALWYVCIIFSLLQASYTSQQRLKKKWEPT